MIKKIFLVFVFSTILIACDSNNNPSKPSVNEKSRSELDLTGHWRGVLASPGGELPFGIEISINDSIYSAKIINGEERVDTSSVTLIDNELTIEFEWYDARIKATISEDGQSMQGQWSKTAPKKISKLVFTATKGDGYRFNAIQLNANELAEKWQVTFTDEDGDFPAVAEFQQQDNKVTGTFLTATGDYRYLEGDIQDGKLSLSVFDGAHAFLFTALLKDKTLIGDFWSRDTYHATWQATPVENTTNILPNSWEMNKVTTEDHSVSFAFEDLDGKVVKLTDERFKDKPVIINLFGTWCPNCNDEAPVLAGFYRKYQSQGLEIIGLAFEFTEDPVRDKKQITAFKKRHNIDYPLLLAGGNDKSKATKILGFLDKVIAYPTSLYLDKSHKVVRIHTGFSGPGTGEHYTQLIKEIENNILNLLKELNLTQKIKNNNHH